MSENKDNKYYYAQICKSLLTAIACLYLSKYDDIRDFCCVVGFLSSVLTVSWIKDLINNRRGVS